MTHLCLIPHCEGASSHLGQRQEIGSQDNLVEWTSGGVQPNLLSKQGCEVRPGCSGCNPVRASPSLNLSYINLVIFVVSHPPILHHWEKIWLHLCDSLPVASAEAVQPPWMLLTLQAEQAQLAQAFSQWVPMPWLMWWPFTVLAPVYPCPPCTKVEDRTGNISNYRMTRICSLLCTLGL